MNSKEAAQILAVVRTAYPNTKIEDAGAMVQAWVMGLGDYSASSVMKAARLHMETAKFFPTIAEIRNNIVRAELIYTESDIETNRIEPSKQKLLGNNTDLVVTDDVEDLTFDMLADLEPSEACLKCAKLHECYPDYK